MKELEKIKVGDYVRTNNGIFIISHINIDFDDSDYKKVCLCQNEKVAFTNIDTIKELKHSPNIIDLIEVGDIIRTEYLLDTHIKLFGKYHITHIEDKELLESIKIGFKDKSLKLLGILTKEQYSSMEYRLEE